MSDPGPDLGSFGVWRSLRLLGAGNGGAAARLAEELGFGAFWLGGSPRLADVRPLLEATERIVVATGIVNVWRYEPSLLAREHAALVADFPGRLLLGIGISHPESNEGYARPLETMRAFLDGLDAADPPVPHQELCLAALGPKMLELSAERTRGAHPYFVPVEHTRFAREVLGDGPLLAPELACVLHGRSDRARETAREYARTYLRLSNYVANLHRLGYGPGETNGDGSDALIDAVIPHGSAADVARAAREHLAAGADHVCLQPLGEPGIPRAGWTALADAIGLR
jgi:probable F420-dependent oxidoreductase